jgi:hypothetical protein
LLFRRFNDVFWDEAGAARPAISQRPATPVKRIAYSKPWQATLKERFYTDGPPAVQSLPSKAQKEIK